MEHSDILKLYILHFSLQYQAFYFQNKAYSILSAMGYDPWIAEKGAFFNAPALGWYLI